MKIRDLVRYWEKSAKGRMTQHSYTIPLDVETAARLAALHDMYPKRSVEELLGELVASALEELEASFPYVKGTKVVALDEQGDPLYEDIGPTPRFLGLARKYLHEMTGTKESAHN